MRDCGSARGVYAAAHRWLFQHRECRPPTFREDQGIYRLMTNRCRLHCSNLAGPQLRFQRNVRLITTRLTEQPWIDFDLAF